MQASHKIGTGMPTHEHLRQALQVAGPQPCSVGWKPGWKPAALLPCSCRRFSLLHGLPPGKVLAAGFVPKAGVMHAPGSLQLYE